MLESVHMMIRRTADKLGLEPEQVEALLKTNAEHVFDIELKNGKSFKAYRVQHNNKRGPYKGGIRFHPEVDLDEVRALSTMMSLKTAAVDIPLGGGKGGVVVNPRELSGEELEELSRGYARGLAEHIGPEKDVPAPDVNTNAQVIDWMVDEYEKTVGRPAKGSFTGKSLENGGSLGREAATGRGGVIVLKKLLELSSKADEPLTVAVQGYGNVGSFFATVAKADCPQWKVVAAGDTSGGVYAEDGLDVDGLAEFKKNRGHFVDFGAAEHITSDELLSLDVDVLVLAALGDEVTEANMKNVQAHYIVELANGPVNEAAYEFLTEKGAIIVPDIVANAGGVVVSYLEWLQNQNDEKWSEEKVNERLTDTLEKATEAMYETAEAEDVSLKEAAFMVAIKRLVS